MKGHHDVKLVEIKAGDEVSLEMGWKPFAVLGNDSTSKMYLVLRRWERDEG